jgi:hypothetical protein
VPEARLPEGRVARLRLRHAVIFFSREEPTHCLVRTWGKYGQVIFAKLRIWKCSRVLLGSQSFLVPSITNGDVDWGRLIRDWSAQAIHNVVCHVWYPVLQSENNIQRQRLSIMILF